MEMLRMPEFKPGLLISRFLSNDPALLGVEITDEPLAGRVRAEQIASILRFTPYMLFANVLLALVFTICFLGTPVQDAALLWAFGLCALVGLTYSRWRASRSAKPRTYASRRAPRKAVVNALILSLVWCIQPLYFLGQADAGARLVVATLTIGMMCGGAFSLASIPAAAMAFALPLAMAGIAGALLFNLPYAPALAALLALFTFIIVRSSFSLASLLLERLLGQYEQEKHRDMISILLGEFEQNASDWLWETDARGRIKYVSSRFAELVGRPMRQIIGKPFAKVMLYLGARDSDDQMRAHERLAEQMRNHAPFRSIDIKLDINGATHWCSLTGKPVLEASGHFLGFRGFGSDITGKREDEAKIAWMARYDAVTGLPNRVLFREHLHNALAQLRKQGIAFCLHCIDLDGFKDINDSFGHAAGDLYLKEVGRRISACLGPDETAARLGGDEFALIQINCDNPAAAADFAQRIIVEISKPLITDSYNMSAGASIGIAMAPTHGDDADKLLVNADLALYRAKSEGRGTCRFFELSMDEEARERRTLEAELRTAVTGEQFELVFQPVMNMASGKIDSCEALLRWPNERRGIVSPAEFIPLAEENGLIVPIGEWVIRKACAVAAAWPEHTRMAINLSPAQFHSPGLLPAVMQALEQTGLAPGRLEIEVTESVLIANVERVRSILDTLKRVGVRIALDDFGTGYSSLSYLRQIQFDKVKIDSSFVRDMIDDERCAAIVRAVTSLARELDMEITAEGVETEAQLEFMRHENCTGIQGFLVSPPVPEETMKEFIERGVDEDQETRVRVA